LRCRRRSQEDFEAGDADQQMAPAVERLDGEAVP